MTTGNNWNLASAVPADKPNMWEDVIERGADAIRETRSNDCIKLALVALRAAIRGSDDVEQLLTAKPSTPMRPPRPKPRRTSMPTEEMKQISVSP
jgi:hypothetical protein